MALHSRRQRLLLWSFIGSISLCGLVGIYCLLAGSFGQLQARVLGSTAAIAGASILALAATIPWGRRVWRPIGPSGCAAATIALALGLIAIWTDENLGKPYYKTTSIACVFGVALPHVGLLSLARLRQSYNWARLATVVFIAFLAVLVIATILAEPRDDAWWRMIGVLSILSTSGTIAVPILHRLSAIPIDRQSTTATDRITLTCPRCGHSQEVLLGRSKCSECELGFRIDVEDPSAQDQRRPRRTLRG